MGSQLLQLICPDHVRIMSQIMRRAALIFNPNAGRGARVNAILLDRVAATLREHDLAIDIIATQAPGSAGQQAAEAIAGGADLIFACGGDGTLHDTIQTLVHHPSAVLGIIPLGSANALARHLGLSLDPVHASLQQLSYQPRVIPLGRITFQTPQGERSRYFAVMAGAGPDGALVYKMLATGKRRLGRSTYYLRAARLFLGSRFASFHLSASTVDGTSIECEVVSAMIIRVGNLGGLFSPLVRGASPYDHHLHLALTLPPAHLSLPAWFTMSWARLHRWDPYSKVLRVNTLSCSAGTRPVHAQADGEWLGATPMRIEIVPNALRLLMPTSLPER
jgi:diacylglycerol kinase family enzyme